MALALDDGTKYRVIHHRWIEARLPSSAVVVDPSGTVTLTSSRVAMTLEPLRLASKGGATRVEILDDDGVVLAVGTAQCRADENFSRKIGRAVALGRALKELKNGQ